jgi:predicted anti-sigma-YlaC factor YlaD
MANLYRRGYHILLVRAILNLPDDRLDCITCQAWLPGYVDAEVAGIAALDRYRPLRRHLLLCPACSELYLNMLHMAMLEDQGKISPPTACPDPDLSFLASEGFHE